MADNLGREPIPGVAGASGCPHPTQLSIPMRWRNRGKARQVGGAFRGAEDPSVIRSHLFRGPTQGRDAGGMTATCRLAAILAADVAGYSRLIVVREPY